LRFPPDAPAHLRRGAARKEQRRDLPRDDEEVPGRRLSHCGNARAPLPSGLRQVAVLQLSAHLSDGDRRDEAVVAAGHPQGASQGPMSADTVYRGRRVMITGGLGFVGINLAHRLVQLGADVLLVDSLIPEYGGKLFNNAGIEDKVTVNVADVRQASTMNYLVQGREVIFNLAGQVSHIDSMRDPH